MKRQITALLVFVVVTTTSWAASQPGTQARNISFSNVTPTQIRVSCTRGSGSRCLIVAKAGSAITGVPTDGVTYSANSVFESGSTIAAGEYVVYAGTGSAVTVTGLDPSTTYYFRVFEYNTGGGSPNPNYNPNTGTNNPNSRKTAPTCTVTGPTSPTNTSPIVFTITFSDSVTGLTASDITVGNGSKGTLGGSGSTYTMPVTPSGQVAVTCSVGANAAQDSAGNNNTASNNLSITYDSVAPSCTVSGPAATNSSPITFTLTFSEAVTGLSAADIVVGNGSKGTLSGSGTTYSIPVTPSGQGSVTCQVSASAAQDGAGNNCTASNNLGIIYDTVRPTVTITGPASPTNDNPIMYTITFSESVTGFGSGDITVNNGSKGTFSGSGTTYTIAVTPSGQTAVTCTVAAGVAQDAATNTNQGPASLVITYDSVAPTCSVTGPSSPTNTSPIVFTITFSESVTGLTESDISVGNGSKGTLSGSGMTYTIPVTPTAQGAVTCQVAAGAAADAAGNSNTISNNRSITYDSVCAATVSGPGSPTRTSPITFTINFGESVTGLTAGDITVTNGSKGSLSGSGASYTIPVTPSGQGEVTCQVHAGAAQDSVGNVCPASNECSIIYDSVQPGCSVTGPVSPTKNSPITFTITFTESVSGLSASDITVGNGSKGTLSGSGTTYTIPVTPSGQGTVTCQVVAGAATDAAGNSSTISNNLSISYDSVVPTCSVTGPSSPTNDDPITFTITFSEAVSGLTEADINVGNGSKGTLSGSGTTYTIPVTPSAQGAVTCQVAAGAATDAAGNGNTISNNLSLNFDSITPTCTVSGPASPTRTSPITFTITFSESVTGLTAGDITVGNGSKGSLSGSGTTYTIPITPTGQGAVTCQVNAGMAQDGAGNLNTVSNNLSITYDSVAPTCTVTGPASPTNVSPIVFTITLSESLGGLTASDITVSNGSKGTLSGSGTSYTIPVTPSGQGNVTCQVIAGAITDAAGNTSAASNNLGITYDTVGPTCTITGPTSPSNDSPMVFTINFNEAVAGFSADDITVTNGIKGTLSGSGAGPYTLPVTPSGQVAVSCQISAGAVTDVLGQAGSASNLVSVVFDNIAPTCAVTSSGVATQDMFFTFTINFSEPVSGLSLGDIDVGNALKISLNGSGAGPYTVTVFVLIENDVTCQVPAGSAQDAAGNGNVISNEQTVSYDLTSPDCTVSASSPTNLNPINFTLTFTEPVTTPNASKITVSGGTKGTITGSGTTWIMPVTPTAQGNVSCQVTAGAAEDLAGNECNQSNNKTVVFDSIVPTVTVTAPASPTKVSPLTFTVAFSESVTGLTPVGVSVTNGSVTAVNGSGTNYTVTVTPAGTGTVTFQINAGAAHDAAGNGCAVSNLGSVEYDVTPPTVTITGPASPTKNNPIVFTLTFSESVSGLVAGDLNISGGTPGSLSGSGAVYTIPVTPAGQNAVTCQLKANAVQDQVGNVNALSSVTAIVYDSVPPTCGVTGPASPTNNNPINFSITFSETVTGLSAAGITVNGGDKGVLSGSGAGPYTMPVTPTGDGPIMCMVNAGAAQDLATNPCGASAVCSVTYDATAPGVVLSSGVAAQTNASFSVTANFSEPVTGFQASSIGVTNGSVSGFSGSGASYTWTVMPSGQGSVQVSIGANAVTDAAGNGNSASNTISTIYDSIAPGVSLSSTATSPTHTSPIPMTATFTEAVDGLALGSIQVTGGTAGSITKVSSSVYQFSVTPTASEGSVSVTIAAGAGRDAATNPSTASTPFAIAYDSVAPTVTVTGPASPTGVSPISFEIRFSESVTGLTADKINVSGGTKGLLTGNGAGPYSLQVTPNGQGTVSCQVPAGAVQDTAGNVNQISNNLAIDYDSGAPTVTVTGPASPTGSSPITFTITFNEPVSGFTAAGINVTGGAKGAFAGGGASYTIQVAPGGQGNVTCQVIAGAAHDAAGNGNTASTPLSIEFDSVGPDATVSCASTLTRTSPIVFSIVFSEPVANLDAGMIQVFGGNKGALSGSGTNFTLNVTPTAQGIVSCQVDDAAARDLAGNPSVMSNIAEVTYDSVAPAATSVTRLNPASASTNASLLEWRVSFSEPVVPASVQASCFVPQTVSGDLPDASVASITVINNRTVDVAVNTGAGEGELRLDVPPSSICDPAGNTIASGFQGGEAFTIDRTQPGVTLSSGVGAKTNGAFTVSAHFTEPVNGFEASDISVTNGTAGSFSGSGANYSWNVTPTSDGAVQVRVADGVALDAAGNLNTVSNIISTTRDSVAPAIASVTPAANSTVPSLTEISITFSEPVGGVEAQNLTVNGSPADSVEGSGSGPYVFTGFAEPAQGTVSVVLAGSIHDDAGNQLPATNWSCALDSSALIPDLQGAVTSGHSTSNDTVHFAIMFNETVRDFGSDVITITGGNIENFGGSGASYSFDAVASAPGTVSISIPAHVIESSAVPGKWNRAAGPYTFTYDVARPSVALTSGVDAYTNASFIVSAAFSEPVVDFNAGKVACANATISQFSGSGANYSWTVTPNNDGAVSAQLLESAVHDEAGNANTASNTISTTCDRVRPSVTLSSTAGNITHESPIVVIATFDKAVSGFDEDDVLITGGRVGGFTVVSQTVYSFEAIPSADNATLGISISANAVSDAAGNGNEASNSLGIEYDAVAPTATVSVAATPTRSNPVVFNIQFSEPVTVNADSITVEGGSKGMLSGSGANYTLPVSPVGEGEVSCLVPAGAAQDAAGNGNTVSNRLVAVYDSIAPHAVSINRSEPANEITPATAVVWRVVFSEAIDAGSIRAEDFTVALVSGTLAGYSVAGIEQVDTSTYDVRVNTGSGGGVLRLDLNNSPLLHDLAGNALDSGFSDGQTYTIDRVGPTVTLAKSVGAQTNAAFDVSVTFSSNVTGFSAERISISNGAIGNFAGSGTTYTFTVTPADQGMVQVFVGANSATDDNGNGNSASNALNVTYDTVAPRVTLSSSASDPTCDSPVPFMATFSEPVAGVNAGVISATGGTVGNVVVVSDSVYTFDVTPASDNVRLVVRIDNAVTDLAGNALIASTPLGIDYDAIAPAVTVGGPKSPTRISPIDFSITFNKPVRDFNMDRVNVGRGTKHSLSGSGAGPYILSVVPTGQGKVDCQVPAGAARSLAGKFNTVSNDDVVIYDSVPPSVDIASARANTSENMVEFAIQLTEPTTPLTSDSLTVTGGIIRDLKGSDTSYTLQVAAVNQGAVTCQLGAGLVYDAAENGNNASNVATSIYDTLNPVPTLRITGVDDNMVTISISFSEPVVGFDRSDITIDGGDFISLQTISESSYKLVFRMAESYFGVLVPALKVQDLTGNWNVAPGNIAYTFDGMFPAVTVSTLRPVTNQSPIAFTIQFDQAVIFGQEGVLVTGGRISSFAQSGLGLYTVEVNPAGEGIVTCKVPENAARGMLEDYGNAESNTAQAIYDSLAPNITIDAPSSMYTYAGPVDYKVHYYGASIVELTPARVRLIRTETANAVVTVIDSASNTPTVRLRNITGHGTLSFTIDFGSAADVAGNMAFGSAAAIPVKVLIPGRTAVKDWSSYE